MKTTNHLRALQTMLLTLFSLTSIAYDFEVDGIYYRIRTDSTVNVTYRNYQQRTDSYTGILTIPTSVIYDDINYTIVGIDQYTFYWCNSLTQIEIPSSVKVIGERAFSNCTTLTSIIIPSGVASIGDWTFYHCDSLSSITIPSSVTSIGDWAFQDCSSLDYVNISSIESWCKVKFKNTHGSSYSNPLSYAHKLYLNGQQIKSLSIPSNVSSVSNYAFLGCSSLTSITIPNSVTSIGDRAFAGCSGVTSITIPSSVTSIGSSAFYNIKEVKIENVKSYLGINFAGETFSSSYDIIVNGLKLTDLVIPEDVTKVGKFTFYGCTSIESITFHKDVATIVQNAFNGCTNVKQITCQGDTPPVCGTDALTGISRTDCPLYVPDSSGSSYQSTTPWSEFSNIIGGTPATPSTPETCNAPAITFDNTTKQLKFESSTEGAQYHYTITSDDMATDSTSSDGIIQMLGVYDIIAYASAEGMYNSEKTTVKLLWVNAVIDTSTDVLNAQTQRGVIVSTTGSNINIAGTVEGEIVVVYSISGTMVKSITANSDKTEISGLPVGTYIVKIGGTCAKVAL